MRSHLLPERLRQALEALQSDPSRRDLMESVRSALLDGDLTMSIRECHQTRPSVEDLEARGVIGEPLPCGDPSLWHLFTLRQLFRKDWTLSIDHPARFLFHSRALLRLDDPSNPAWKVRISVVIPVFNRAHLVGEAIESALRQKGPSVEVIVVDDGSCDEIDRALNPFLDSIRVLRQSNQGVAAARNRGLSIASGDYIHFLDSDNLVQPGFYQATINALQAVPDAGICYAAPNVNGRTASVSLSGEFWNSAETYTIFAKDYELHGASNCSSSDLMAVVAERHPFLMLGVVLPCWLVQSIGCFDSRLRRGEDTFMWFQLGLKNTKVIGLKKPMNRRRWLSSGLTATRTRQNSAVKDWLRLLSLTAAPAQWHHAFTVVSTLLEPGVWPGEHPHQEPCLPEVTLQLLNCLRGITTAKADSSGHFQSLMLAIQQMAATVTHELQGESARSLAEELRSIAGDAWPPEEGTDAGDTGRLRVILTVMAEGNWWSCASPGGWFDQLLDRLLPPGMVACRAQPAADVVGAPCDLDAARWHRRALDGVLRQPPSLTLRARIAYHAAWLLASLPGSPSVDHYPLVSVVIPVHDRVALAAEAVASALAQTYPRLEVIVIDDGSSEDLRQALLPFLPRLRLLRQPNLGPAAARNLGIHFARGQLIHFLDADDLLDAEAVARKVEALRAVPDADLVYSGLHQSGECAHEIGQPCRYQKEPEDHEGSPTRDLLAVSAVRYPFQTSTVMLPRWILLAEEGFDHRLWWGEDGHLFFRLGLRGTKCIGIRGRTTHRRIGEGNLTSVQPTSRQWALSKGLRLLTLLQRGDPQQISRFCEDTCWPLMESDALISLTGDEDPSLDDLREDLVTALRSKLSQGSSSLRHRLSKMLEQIQEATPILRDDPYLLRLHNAINATRV